MVLHGIGGKLIKNITKDLVEAYVWFLHSAARTITAKWNQYKSFHPLNNLIMAGYLDMFVISYINITPVPSNIWPLTLETSVYFVTPRSYHLPPQFIGVVPRKWLHQNKLQC